MSPEFCQRLLKKSQSARVEGGKEKFKRVERERVQAEREEEKGRESLYLQKKRDRNKKGGRTICKKRGVKRVKFSAKDQRKKG